MLASREQPDAIPVNLPMMDHAVADEVTGRTKGSGGSMAGGSAASNTQAIVEADQTSNGRLKGAGSERTRGTHDPTEL